jgi:serine/threonine protein kinase, bacterial
MMSRAPASGELPGVGGALGPYRIESLLGEGATGVVYAARRDGGDLVALKVLRRELSENESYRRRFEREVRVARELEHRHLVPILDQGEADGHPYLAFAYMPGGSLADVISATGRLPLPDVLRLSAEIAAGLDLLHSHGIVHRDVKPPNVMLDEEGHAAVADLGMAKSQAYTVLTRPGTVMGTLDYLAPELVSGAPATPASDIYSLGCLVFECLTGKPPFAGRATFQTALAHLHEDPPSPAADRPELPAGVSWAVLQALRKDPQQRPATATAFANMLAVGARPKGPDPS